MARRRGPRGAPQPSAAAHAAPAPSSASAVVNINGLNVAISELRTPHLGTASGAAEARHVSPHLLVHLAGAQPAIPDSLPGEAVAIAVARRLEAAFFSDMPDAGELSYSHHCSKEFLRITAPPSPQWVSGMRRAARAQTLQVSLGGQRTHLGVQLGSAPHAPAGTAVVHIRGLFPDDCKVGVSQLVLQYCGCVGAEVVHEAPARVSLAGAPADGFRLNRSGEVVSYVHLHGNENALVTLPETILLGDASVRVAVSGFGMAEWRAARSGTQGPAASRVDQQRRGAPQSRASAAAGAPPGGSRAHGPAPARLLALPPPPPPLASARQSGLPPPPPLPPPPSSPVVLQPLPDRPFPRLTSPPPRAAGPRIPSRVVVRRAAEDAATGTEMANAAATTALRGCRVARLPPLAVRASRAAADGVAQSAEAPPSDQQGAGKARRTSGGRIVTAAAPHAEDGQEASMDLEPSERRDPPRHFAAPRPSEAAPSMLAGSTMEPQWLDDIRALCDAPLQFAQQRLASGAARSITADVGCAAVEEGLGIASMVQAHLGRYCTAGRPAVAVACAITYFALLDQGLEPDDPAVTAALDALLQFRDWRRLIPAAPSSAASPPSADKLLCGMTRRSLNLLASAAGRQPPCPPLAPAPPASSQRPPSPPPASPPPASLSPVDECLAAIEDYACKPLRDTQTYLGRWEECAHLVERAGCDPISRFCNNEEHVRRCASYYGETPPTTVVACTLANMCSASGWHSEGGTDVVPPFRVRVMIDAILGRSDWASGLPASRAEELLDLPTAHALRHLLQERAEDSAQDLLDAAPAQPPPEPTTTASTPAPAQAAKARRAAAASRPPPTPYWQSTPPSPSVSPRPHRGRSRHRNRNHTPPPPPTLNPYLVHAVAGAGSHSPQSRSHGPRLPPRPQPADPDTRGGRRQ